MTYIILRSAGRPGRPKVNRCSVASITWTSGAAGGTMCGYAAAEEIETDGMVRNRQSRGVPVAGGVFRPRPARPAHHAAVRARLDRACPGRGHGTDRASGMVA